MIHEITLLVLANRAVKYALHVFWLYKEFFLVYSHFLDWFYNIVFCGMRSTNSTLKAMLIYFKLDGEVTLNGQIRYIKNFLFIKLWKCYNKKEWMNFFQKFDLRKRHILCGHFLAYIKSFCQKCFETFFVIRNL